tara:strand:- start:44465 stop:44863 length:399 start_codon:yes stop_codon:yes gene_type:complete
MKIEGELIHLAKAKSNVYQFLSTLENYSLIMPESNKVFEIIDYSRFKFGLKGMPEIVLKLVEGNDSNTVVLSSDNDKFPFTLSGLLHSVSEEETQVKLVFEGDFNPMMEMMIKSPLTAFVNDLSKGIELQLS